jgi:hypothetical protein
VSALVQRDAELELDTLDRIERLSRVAGYAERVTGRLDDVEAQGGPDAPARAAVDAVRGAHEEAVDGSAWAIVASTLIAGEVRGAVTDGEIAAEIDVLLQDAMVAFARAEDALRGCLMLLGQ